MVGLADSLISKANKNYFITHPLMSVGCVYSLSVKLSISNAIATVFYPVVSSSGSLPKEHHRPKDIAPDISKVRLRWRV
jgi:hypothetical protein